MAETTTIRPFTAAAFNQYLAERKLWRRVCPSTRDLSDMPQRRNGMGGSQRKGKTGRLYHHLQRTDLHGGAGLR